MANAPVAQGFRYPHGLAVILLQRSSQGPGQGGLAGALSTQDRNFHAAAGFVLAGDLHQDFIAADHAQVVTGFFFDHVQAFFEVSHFSRKPLVGQQRLLVFAGFMN